MINVALVMLLVWCIALSAALVAVYGALCALRSDTDVVGLAEQRRKISNSLRAFQRLLNEVEGSEDVAPASSRRADVALAGEPLTVDELAEARQRYRTG